MRSPARLVAFAMSVSLLGGCAEIVFGGKICFFFTFLPFCHVHSEILAQGLFQLEAAAGFDLAKFAAGSR